MSDRICCYCRRVYGQKDTKEPSHGVCPECAVDVEKQAAEFEGRIERCARGTCDCVSAAEHARNIRWLAVSKEQESKGE